MTKQEELIKKLFQHKCSQAELEQLFELLQVEPIEDLSTVMKELWSQMDEHKQLDRVLASSIMERTLQRMPPNPKSKTVKLNPSLQRRRFLLSSVAAILLVIMGVAFWIWWDTNQLIKVQTAYGQQESIILPDQSVVKLNANSSIQYKKRWNTKEIRQVWLDGEAYFEVNKNKQTGQKFHVITENLRVEVLGTVFNVNTRRQTTKVFLEEGKVSINLNHQKEPEEILMNPGELVTYKKSNNNLEKKRLEEEAPASWKDGTAILEETPFKEILLKIQDIYGIDIEIENRSALERSFSIGIPVDNLETTQTVLQELTKVNIVAEGDRWIIR